MRILVLNPILFTSDNKGNLPETNTIKETMIYGMCKGFLKLGHEVTLVAAEDFRPCQNEDYDFEIIFMSSKLKNVFKPVYIPFMPDLYRYLTRNHAKFDLILSSEVFSFTSLFASIICSSKTIIWHELTAHNRKFVKLPSLFWYNFVARLFMSKIKVISRSSIANQFISRYCPKTQPLSVDHGIDLDKFHITARKKKQFICISQLIPRKNVNLVIEKFAQFIKCDGFSDYKLFIAGRGELLASLQELTKKLGIENNVLFLGYVNHNRLNEILSESQALLLNTRKDLNVVSIPESLASGTPVITNSVPALSDFIKTNMLGIVNDSWGVNELKEIILNEGYRNNCVQMRQEFSNTTAASKIIQNFLE